MKFRSKPHEIEAFQFTNGNTKPPGWFRVLYENGKAIVVINNQSQFISVETKGGVHKALIGDWVCRNESGTVFVLSNKEIGEEFIPIYNDAKNV